MKISSVLAGFLVLAPLSSITTASANEDSTPKTDAKKSLDPDQKLCRSAPSKTGSMMPKRLCHTRAEWAVIDASEKDDSGQRRALERARMSSGTNR